MNRVELFDAFRRRAGDIRQPYLWKNPEVQEYLDDAHNEAAERSMLLHDTQTPGICEVTIAAGEASYCLDRRIIEVTRAKLDGSTKPLRLTTTEALDLDWPGWDDQDDDEPKRIAIDPEGDHWRATLVPPPAADDILRLQVVRLPLCSITNDKDEPEINPRLHIGLVDWMMYRAYSKKDAETFDATKAADHAADFAATFGPKRDARTNRAQHDRLHPVVRPMGL